MNKYSVAAIVLAVIIGICAGWFGKTNQSNNAILELQKKHETELLEQNKQAERNIQERDKTILELKSLNKRDSIAIVDLEYKIKVDGVDVVKKLKQVQNLNADERKQWLLDRYSN